MSSARWGFPRAVELPDVPIEAIDFIRYAETSAFFDEVTRAGLLTEVERGPEESRHPDEIRSAYFIPAVDSSRPTASVCG